MSELKDIDTGSSSVAKIRYETVHNQLASQKAGSDMNVARVYTNHTYQLKEMAEELVNRKVPLSRQLITYVLGELSDLMQSLLLQGNSINLGGLVKLQPVIKGTFAPGESFNASKHEIVVSATVGKVLRSAASAGSVERVGAELPPEITGISNTIDRQADVIYGGGTTADIQGVRLTFDQNVADEGVFITCPDYEGDDLAVALVKAGDAAITIRIDDAIDAEYTAFLSFKTRQGDKNAEPVELKREVTLKPKPVA